jgi:hypothetical protein
MTAASIGAAKGGGYARYLESKTVEPERGDYYLSPDGEPTQAPGQWLASPETLARLGIEGSSIEGPDFIALMEGRHPRSGAWLRRAATTGALGSQPTARPRMSALHQRNEISAIYRLTDLDSQPLQRLRVGQPLTGSLRHLAVRGQVIVPTLRRDGLALQVARVPATSGRTYARRSHHIGNDRQHPEAANEIAQQPHSRASGLFRR